MLEQDAGSSMAGQFPVVPQQDRSRSKRQALLDSAQELFAARGYEKTTAKLIATHAGVAIGTFYRYFTDKRQVLVTLVQDRIFELLPANPEWLNGDPEGALFRLLERHAAQRRRFGLGVALQELTMREPEMAKAISELRQQAYERLADGLRQAFQRGLTWPDIDIEPTAWAIYVLVDSGCSNDAPDRSPTRLLSLAQLICRMVVPPEVLERLKGGAEQKG